MSTTSFPYQDLPQAGQAVVQRFKVLSQQKVEVFSAPARINLIGEHTDYNLGFVLPAAINRRLYFALAFGRKEGYLIDAHNLQKQVQINSTKDPAPKALWAKYFHSMLGLLEEKGHSIPPLTCVFGGDIPIGSGLSSSSALTGGFIYTLNDLLGWSLNRVQIARLAQAAEHRVGLNCGIMDQYAVLHGKANQVIQLDCREVQHQYFPLDLGDYQLVLFNSMVSHSLADSAYNDRRKSCEGVVQTIQLEEPSIQSVRDIDFALLEKHRARLSPTDHQRVLFVLKENERVQATTQALKAGELEQVGQLLYQSHEGLSKDYEVSCEELDFLVNCIKGSPGVLGSRMMGGGFGGCTINLIHKDQLEETANKVREHYLQKFQKVPEMHIVEASEGVRKERP
ncbi:MAG: galactokinase [Bacteroidota bacterium]